MFFPANWEWFRELKNYKLTFHGLSLCDTFRVYFIFKKSKKPPNDMKSQLRAKCALMQIQDPPWTKQKVTCWEGCSDAVANQSGPVTAHIVKLFMQSPHTFGLGQLQRSKMLSSHSSGINTGQRSFLLGSLDGAALFQIEEFLSKPCCTRWPWDMKAIWILHPGPALRGWQCYTPASLHA